MPTILSLNMKMPVRRMRLAVFALRLVLPFLRREETARKVWAVLSAWAVRGVRVYDGKRRIS